MQLLKETLKRTLEARGIFSTRLTPAGEIRELITKLRPVETEHRLVRLGPDGDGGYLVPDDLDGIEACFSPGVSTVSGFEKDCAERGIRTFLADRSVAGPAEAHELFHFTRKFVGAVSSSDFMTLDDWVAASNLESEDSDLLLQMDIEGAEYEVLLSTSERLLRRFRVIVAEFHHLEQYWNKPYFDIVRRSFDKITAGHTCVHIHPNNCCGSVIRDGIELPSIMEFTFFRNDRFKTIAPRTAFPHPLDRDNTEKPSMVLPACWYVSGA